MISGLYLHSLHDGPLIPSSRPYFSGVTKTRKKPRRMSRSKRSMTTTTTTTTTTATTTKLCYRLSYDDFLTLDGPTGISVSPDDTRGNFFLHLGLSEHNNRHLWLYSKMEHEASLGMERLFASRDCLQPELARDHSVQPPYSPMQMTERAFQREIDTIYKTASRQTQGIYDLIRTPEGHNWVIRWMLWQVLQEMQRTELRATSSGSSAQTEVSMLSTCSTVTDCASIQTEAASPPYSPPLSTPWFAAAAAPALHEYSPDHDPGEPERKVIKLDPEAAPAKPPCRSAGYWNHVLNT